VIKNHLLFKNKITTNMWRCNVQAKKTTAQHCHHHQLGWTTMHCIHKCNNNNLLL